MGQADTLWLSSVSSQQVKELGLTTKLPVSLNGSEGHDFPDSVCSSLFLNIFSGTNGKVDGELFRGTVNTIGHLGIQSFMT